MSRVGNRRDYFSAAEFGRIVGVSPFTVVRWIRAGKIEAFRIEHRHKGSYRITRASAMSFMKNKGLLLSLLPPVDDVPFDDLRKRCRKDIFTTGDVAKICRVAARTVAKWFESGKLRGYRIPGSQDRRIPRENLIDFLREHNMPLRELAISSVLLIGCSDAVKNAFCVHLPMAPLYTSVGWFDAGILLEQNRPETMVVDLSIGRSQCITAVRAVRTIPRYADARIIALACEDESAVSELIEAGFNEVVSATASTDAVVQAAKGVSR